MRPLTFVALAVVATAFAALAVGSLVGSIVGSSSPAFDAPSAPDVRTHTVLVTGWGPFLQFRVNPSGELAGLLNGTCRHVLTRHPASDFRLCIKGIVLPVNRSGVLSVEELLRRTRGEGIDAILHLGLEDMAKGLKLEVAAINRKANDTGGPSHTEAVRGAPFIETTTAHLGRLMVDQGRRGHNPYYGGLGVAFPENVTDAWSRDAGDYYCNELLYRSVHLIREERLLNARGALLPAIFMHLPNRSVSSLEEDSEFAVSVASRLILSLEDSAGDKNEKGMVVAAAGWFAAVLALGVGGGATLGAVVAVGCRLRLSVGDVGLDGVDPDEIFMCCCKPTGWDGRALCRRGGGGAGAGACGCCGDGIEDAGEIVVEEDGIDAAASSSYAGGGSSRAPDDLVPSSSSGGGVEGGDGATGDGGVPGGARPWVLSIQEARPSFPGAGTRASGSFAAKTDSRRKALLRHA